MAATPSNKKDTELEEQEQYIAAKRLRKGKTPMKFRDTDSEDNLLKSRNSFAKHIRLGSSNAGPQQNKNKTTAIRKQDNKPVKKKRVFSRNDDLDEIDFQDLIAYERKLEGTMDKVNKPYGVRGRRSFVRRSRFNPTNGVGIQQEQSENPSVTITKDAEQVNTAVGTTQQACTTQEVQDDHNDKSKGVLVTNVNEELKWFFKARDGQTMGPCSLWMLNLLKTHDPVASDFKVWSIGHNEDTSLPLSFVVSSFYKGD